MTLLSDILNIEDTPADFADGEDDLADEEDDDEEESVAEDDEDDDHTFGEDDK